MATPRRALFWIGILASTIPFSQQTFGGDDGILVFGGENRSSPSDPASIVGGTPSTYPFMALKEFKLFGYCTAVLIHEDILISAAHCYNFWAGSNVCVGANKWDCSDASEVILAERDYVHPDFYPNFRFEEAQNDIMLVKLSSPSSAPPANWNRDANVPAEDSLVIAIGFGVTEPSSFFGIPNFFSIPDVINEVNLTVGDSGTCARVSDIFMRNTTICAYGDGLAGICSFDSGGSLLSPDGTLVGISSFAFLPCGSSLDGFFRVSAFDSWIEETICGLSNNPPEGCELPPDWPEVSPWIGPCGKQDCNIFLFGPGVKLKTFINVFGLFSLCFELCFFNWIAGFFTLIDSWYCGVCDS